MWITRNIIARTLIWLAAITLPVQSLPAMSCGCDSGRNCCTGGKSKKCGCSAKRVRESRSCCAAPRDKTARSCCSKAKACQKLHCTCGTSCQCCKGQLPKPVTPPSEDNATQKVTSDSSLTISPLATVFEPEARQRPRDVTFGPDCLAALERCISLCRFAL